VPTYHFDLLAPIRLLRCDGCGQSVATGLPGTTGPEVLTAVQVVTRYPEVADQVTTHELTCGPGARKKLAPSPSAKCLTCRNRRARARGCCNPCYKRHLLAVGRGETTWRDLEQRGLVGPPRPKKGQAD
jgi:hypothetical protein